MVERALGARAEPWDVNGRQGAYDALLHLPDGRTAAFEVMRLAHKKHLQRDSLLRRDGYEWELNGRWWWDITVGSASDIPTLREHYLAIIALCEAVDVAEPRFLPRSIRERDERVRWLLAESTVSMLGHPDVPAKDGNLERHAMVMPGGGRGGQLQRSLTGLTDALQVAFSTEVVQRHFAKLTSPDARAREERHLFLIVHPDVLPFDVYYPLAFEAALPFAAPPVPDHVTHLWLDFSYGNRVLAWAPQGWNSYPVAD